MLLYGIVLISCLNRTDLHAFYANRDVYKLVIVFSI